MKGMALAMAVLLVGPVALPSVAKQDDKNLEGVKKLAQELVKKVDSVYKVEKNQANRKRLEQVKEFLVKNNLIAAIESIQKYVAETRVGLADDKVKETKELVETVIKILLDLKEDKEAYGKILDGILEGLDKAIKEQEGIKGLIDDITRPINELEEKIQELEELIKRQDELSKYTDQKAKEEVTRAIQSEIDRISNLIEKQKGLNLDTLKTQSADLRKLTNLSAELGKLMYDQQKLQDDSGKEMKKVASLEQLLKELDEIIKEQQKILKETAHEKSKKTPDYTNLDKAQEGLTEKLWLDGHEFYHLLSIDHDKKREVRKAMEEAFQAMKFSSDQLRRKNPDLSEDFQKDVINYLEKAKSALTKLVDEEKKDSKKIFDELINRQKELDKLASDIVKQIENSKENTSTATLKALENALSFTKQSNRDMKDATGNIAKGNSKDTNNNQQQAIDNLKRAKDSIDSQAKSLANSKKDDFAKLGSDQGKLGSDANKSSANLGDLAKSGNSAAGKISQAQDAMKNASKAMNQASDGLNSPNIPQAQSNQQESLKNLEDAKKLLEDSLKDLNQGVDKEDVNKKQNKIEKDLEKITNWLKAKQKEMEDKGQKEMANKIKNAVQKLDSSDQNKNSQGAKQDMGDAQNSMNGSKPNMPSTNSSQKQASSKMQDAKKILDDMKNKLQDDVNKDPRLDDMAKKQDKNKSFTDDIAKQLDQLNPQHPANDDMKNSSGNQGDASGNARQKRPKKTKKHVEGALDDLKKAKKKIQKEREINRIETEEEAIRYIETRLKEILERQMAINEGTKDVDENIKQSSGKINSEQSNMTNGLGHEQSKLSDEITLLKAKLNTENVKIFMFVFDAIITDMDMSVELLKKVQVGKPTQELQAEIIKRLQYLIDAFDLLYEEWQKRGRTPDDDKPPKDPKDEPAKTPRPKKEPLVPDEVQLNLFKKMQEMILNRTEGLQNKIKETPQSVTELEKQMLKNLTDQQGRLGSLFKEYVEDFKKD